MSRTFDIHPDRLCAAADACLAAFHEAVGMGWEMLPVQLWDTEVGDRRYRGYLRAEIEEAQRFLLRAGLIARRAT